MFINKNKYNRLVKELKRVSSENSVNKIKLSTLRIDYRLLRFAFNDTNKALFKLDNTVHNLIEIARTLVTDKDRKKVLATTEDGTKITIGDVLEGDYLIPRLESEQEYKTAII